MPGLVISTINDDETQIVPLQSRRALRTSALGICSSSEGYHSTQTKANGPDSRGAPSWSLASAALLAAAKIPRMAPIASLTRSAPVQIVGLGSSADKQPVACSHSQRRTMRQTASRATDGIGINTVSLRADHERSVPVKGEPCTPGQLRAPDWVDPPELLASRSRNGSIASQEWVGRSRSKNAKS